MTENNSSSTELLQSSSPSLQTVSLDTAFELFGNQRRRCVVQRLQEAGEPMQLSELEAEIAGIEIGTAADVSDVDAERVRISLYHVHLPKLADAGLVEYDAEEEVVSLTERAEQFEPYLRQDVVSESVSMG